LRLEKTGLAPRGFYTRRTAPWDIPKPRIKKVMAKGTGPSPIRMRLKRIGHLHAGTVIQAVERHAINSFDAAELMGMRYGSFGKLKAALG
jgi:hypothetical protein